MMDRLMTSGLADRNKRSNRQALIGILIMFAIVGLTMLIGHFFLDWK